jgi:tetratricopeptide (TPR) repeat protein
MTLRAGINLSLMPGRKIRYCSNLLGVIRSLIHKGALTRLGKEFVASLSHADEAVILNLISGLYYLGCKDQSLELLSMYSRKYSDVENMHLKLAWQIMPFAQPDELVKLVQSKIETKKLNGVRYLQLAVIHGRCGDWDRAVRIIEDASLSLPVIDGYGLLGYIRFLMGGDLDIFEQYLNNNEKLGAQGVVGELRRMQWKVCSGSQDITVDYINDLGVDDDVKYNWIYNIAWLYYKRGNHINARDFFHQSYSHAKGLYWLPLYVSVLQTLDASDDVLEDLYCQVCLEDKDAPWVVGPWWFSEKVATSEEILKL